MDDYVHAKGPSSADDAARLRTHVQDRLNLLEKNGHCQVCNTTRWVLLSSGDAAGQTTATQLAGWPTYALACGNCGFVRHHLKSIFDGNDSLAYPDADGSRLAAVPGPGDRMLEAKIAVLEKIAASTDDLLAELRWDLRAVRCKQEDDFRSLAERIGGHAEKLAETMSGSTLKLCAVFGLAVLGLLGVMAKGFRWF